MQYYGDGEMNRKKNKYKRVLCIYICTLLCMGSSGCGTKSADYTDNVLSGNPIASTDIYYTAFKTPKEGMKYAESTYARYDGEGNYISGTEYQYDKQGNVTLRIQYGEGKEESRRTEYRYDSEGKLLEETMTGEDDCVILHTVCEYDARGRRIIENTDNGGPVTTAYLYEYYDNGSKRKVTELCTLDGKNEKTVFDYSEAETLLRYEKIYTNGDVDLCLYEYDALNREISSEEYKNNVLKSKTLQEYDSFGNVTKVSEYDGNLVLSRHWIREYDSTGRELQNYSIDDDGNIIGGAFNTYNSKGELVSCADYLNDELWYTDQYEYDDMGRLLITTRYDSKGRVKSVQECEYTSDQNNSPLTLYMTEGSEGQRYRYQQKEFDSDGHLSKEDTYDEAGTLICHQEYSADGILLQKLRYSSDGVLISWEQYHDAENSILIEAVYNDDGSGVNYAFICLYDQYGNKTESRKYGKGGILESKNIYQYTLIPVREQ